MHASPSTDPADTVRTDGPDLPGGWDEALERLAPHWDPRSFPSRLNVEWGRLAADPDNVIAADSWTQDPAFAGLGRLDTLDQIVFGIQEQGCDLARRDAMLLALLCRCQDGDGLAGRVVLQVMLPKVVRLAMGIVRRPDVGGEPEEAFALAVAAMWQAIATYPVSRRPAKVPANLALDGLAIVQRGHTGSSYRKRMFPERPSGDIALLAGSAHHDVDPDDLSGPVDAELCTLLAWGVRTGVVRQSEALLLARVYGLAEQPGQVPDGPAIAAELEMSWAALRQRCHRLARRLGQAAVAAGIQSVAPAGAILRAA